MRLGAAAAGAETWYVFVRGAAGTASADAAAGSCPQLYMHSSCFLRAAMLAAQQTAAYCWCCLVKILCSNKGKKPGLLQPILHD
jgi:hypothetical protein